MNRWFVLAGIIILAGFLPAGAAEIPGKAGIVKSYAKLPLSFEANLGQSNARVKFLSRGSGYTLFLTPTEAVLTLRKRSSGALTPKAKRARRARRAKSEFAVLRMRFLGANPTPDIDGVRKLRGKSNYFIGKDRAKWRTNVPHYAKVSYREIYPGIDLVFYGSGQRHLEYDFIVAPGADASAIELGFEGAKRLEIDAKGDLVLHTNGGKVRQHKPVLYQEVAGVRNEIDGAYVLRDNNRIGFKVGAYDRSRPLIIDPVLSYSSYLGGGGADGGIGIAVDATGHVYVAGHTQSIDFPTTAGSFQEVFQGGDTDAFVAKFDPSVSGEPSLVYATYLGGSGWDGVGGYGYGIDVDPDGNAYVTGWTESVDFPTTDQAFQPNIAGLSDAFVTKLNADGSVLLFSTYLGGPDFDGGDRLALDGSGNAYITGAAYPGFPTSGGAFQTLCENDAFVAKLNSSGSTLVYSTCLGGSAEDSGEDIAVDGNGNAYVTGYTFSTDFPTVNPLQLEKRARNNTAFVTKLTADGSGLVYSTYLGGSGGEFGLGIAVDEFGNAYITGRTHSTDFPTTANAFQQKIAGCKPHSACSDAFVVKLNPEGNLDDFCLDADGFPILCDDPGVAVEIFPYSTYLGGKETDTGYDIAVNASGRAYVTGQTYSRDFPTTSNAFDTSCGTDGKCNPDQGFLGNDAFVVQLDADGAALVYSSYLGGSGTDSGHGIAVDDAGGAYVTGWTQSTDFPTTENAFQDILAGIQDAFVVKVSEASDPPGGSGGGGPNCEKKPDHPKCQ